MPMVEGAIVIDAPAAGLFALSQDYALRRAWDPFVRDMRFLGGATEAGQGVRVWVRAWTGLTMEVEFTGFRPPTSVAMRMRRGPWFLDRFAGTWLFKPRAAGGTEVTFRYSFTVRGRYLRPLLGPIITRVFRRDVRARLRGLKRGAEQGGLLERLGEPWPLSPGPTA
jgi:ribosome-associated toxin RatA of RatAB toxin-antitoxin module